MQSSQTKRKSSSWRELEQLKEENDSRKGGSKDRLLRAQKKQHWRGKEVPSQT